MPQGEVKGQSVGVSYKQAVQDCIAKVKTVVAECRRNNQKYTDPHFNLDDMDYCLKSLTATSDTPFTDDTPDENIVTFDVTQKAASNGGPIFWGNVQPASTQQEPPEEPTPACAKRVGDIFEIHTSSSINRHMFGTRARELKEIVGLYRLWAVSAWTSSSRN
jgi:hypothetical protein